MSSPTPLASVHTPTTTSVPLSTREIYAYGFGGVGVMVSYHAPHLLANPVYNVLLGVSPIVISNVFAAAQVLALMVGPFLAHISDSIRSRWGRRGPFILFGGVASTLLFVLWFCYPASLSATGFGYYFTAISLLMAVTMLFWHGGYYSLLPEISPHSGERARILGVRLQLCTIATFLTVWAMPIAQSPAFSNVHTGLKAYGIGMGVIMLAGIVAMMLYVKERYYQQAAAAVRVPALEALRQALRIRPMYPLMAATVLLGLAGNLVNTLGYYLTVYYARSGELLEGNRYVAAQGTVWLLSVLFLGGPGVRLCQRIGRNRVFLLCAGLMILASLLKFVCYRAGATFELVIPNLILGPAWSVANVVLQVEAADLTDWDELRSRQRREAVVLTPIGWLSGFSMAIAAGAPGYILAGANFELARGAAQSDGVYANLMLWFAGVPILFTVLAIIVHRYFPITEKYAAEIKRDLELRRGVV